MFQSTPPRGGRPSLFGTEQQFTRVSIHAPERGATCPVAAGCCLYPGFNPRPREGGDERFHAVVVCRHRVSIHAPARGATYVYVSSRRVSRVSIHAPARGATELYVGIGGSPVFQSTPPRGGRPCAGRHCSPSGHVSIHAPARGATPYSSMMV